MKTLMYVGISTFVVLMTQTAANADTDVNKQIRNDRVTVTKPIAQYDINPFVDQQRMTRNDRVSHVLSRHEKASEKKRRVIRTDRAMIIHD